MRKKKSLILTPFPSPPLAKKEAQKYMTGKNHFCHGKNAKKKELQPVNFKKVHMKLTFLVFMWLFLAIDFIIKDVSVSLFVVLISSYILREQVRSRREGRKYLLKYLF